MPEPPSIDELARRFLDLWQQQMAAWATDPETARQVGAWLEAWSKAPGAALGGGVVDLGGIEKRLAAVERRLIVQHFASRHARAGASWSGVSSASARVLPSAGFTNSTR